VNVTQIIDQVLARDDNVAESAAHNAQRRQRILEYLREVHAEIWWARDWPFKRRSADLTVPAGPGTASLPWNFASIGWFGGVYFPVAGTGDGRRLEAVPESVILDLRAGNWRNSTPHIYAIFGQDAANISQLQVEPTGGSYQLTVYYQPNPAFIDEVVGLFSLTDIAVTAVSGRRATLTSTVTDFTTQFDGAQAVRTSGFTNAANNADLEIVGTVTANAMPVQLRSADSMVLEPAGATVDLEGHVEDIKEIPEKYHQLVIIPGLKAKTRESKGDARWQSMFAAYQKAQMDMKREEARFQGEFRQLPSFFGRPTY
jgi:hypothetical protein